MPNRLLRGRQMVLLGAALLTGAMGSRASAATIHASTWTGGSTSTNNWSDAANWDTIPSDSTSGYDTDFVFAGTNRPNSVFDSTASSMKPGSGGFNTRGITFSAGAGAFFLSESNSTPAGLDMLGDRGGANPSNVVNNSTNLQTIGINLIIRNDGYASNLTFNTASGDIAVTSIISGAASGAPIVKTGSGTLTLTGANSFSGTTTITGGTIQINSGGRLGAAASATTVSVQNSATSLSIGSGLTNAIPVGDTLSLAGGGVAGVADAGYLSLGSNNSVKALFLGGVLQSPGTYGSSSSAATFKNDEYFSGTGVLTVTSVPEPGVVGLLLLIGTACATLRPAKLREKSPRQA